MYRSLLFLSMFTTLLYNVWPLISLEVVMAPGRVFICIQLFDRELVLYHGSTELGQTPLFVAHFPLHSFFANAVSTYFSAYQHFEYPTPSRPPLLSSDHWLMFSVFSACPISGIRVTLARHSRGLTPSKFRKLIAGPLTIRTIWVLA